MKMFVSVHFFQFPCLHLLSLGIIDLDGNVVVLSDWFKLYPDLMSLLLNHFPRSIHSLFSTMFLYLCQRNYDYSSL